MTKLNKPALLVAGGTCNKAAYILVACAAVLVNTSLIKPVLAHEGAELPLPSSRAVRPPEELASAPAARTVLAEGRAAVGPAETGGVLAAKQAAVAIALRNAVEKVAGVYVAANSLTRNYQLLKDEILTRADGYAVLKEIVSTTREGDIVRVVVRAEVSTRPLAERLKALRLTRAFRVFIESPEGVPVADLEAAITEAGFPVVESRADADVIARVSPRYVTVADTPLKTAAGPMTLHSVRTTVRVTVLRAETGESIGAVSGGDTAAHIALATARSEAARGALAELSSRLTGVLVTLPARVSEPVEIIVSGVGSATEAAALAETIATTVPGVQKVSRKSYTDGRAVYEADVLADANSLLARALETAPGLRRFHLRVTRETRSRVVAESTSRNSH